MRISKKRWSPKLKSPRLSRLKNLSSAQTPRPMRMNIQLICFTRAMIADPRILILDEATSAVDTETETLIQQALWRLMQGRTTFVAAHRLSTVRHADVILVVQNGRIVESGAHNELMRLGRIYADMFEEFAKQA